MVIHAYDGPKFTGMKGIKGMKGIIFFSLWSVSEIRNCNHHMRAGERKTGTDTDFARQARRYNFRYATKSVAVPAFRVAFPPGFEHEIRFGTGSI